MLFVNILVVLHSLGRKTMIALVGAGVTCNIDKIDKKYSGEEL